MTLCSSVWATCINTFAKAPAEDWLQLGDLARAAPQGQGARATRAARIHELVGHTGVLPRLSTVHA